MKQQLKKDRPTDDQVCAILLNFADMPPLYKVRVVSRSQNWIIDTDVKQMMQGIQSSPDLYLEECTEEFKFNTLDGLITDNFTGKNEKDSMLLTCFDCGIKLA